MKTESKMEKEFMNLISSLGEQGLIELYDECYPNEEDRDLEQEIIEYFSWNNDNPKRQKELINKVKEILDEVEA